MTRLVVATEEELLDEPDFEGMREKYTCRACSGPLMVLGMLGNRTHLRCRNCGAEQSWEEK